LANALLEHETLDTHEVEMIASGKVIPKKFKPKVEKKEDVKTEENKETKETKETKDKTPQDV